MSFIEEQKSQLEGLRSSLKKHKDDAPDDEKFQAASFLQGVVRDFLKLNDLQSSTNVLSERLNGGTFGKLISGVLSGQSTYDSQQAKKQRIQEKLQGQAPRILASLRTFNIDPPRFLLDLLQAGTGPSELAKADPTGYGGAAPPQHQPSNGASSNEGILHSTSEKPYRYKPTNEAHEHLARVVRDIGVDATWKRVVAYIDDQYEDDIPFIVPKYLSSFHKGEIPTLAEALKSFPQRKRFQKILRDVRGAVRHELASQQ